MVDYLRQRQAALTRNEYKILDELRLSRKLAFQWAALGFAGFLLSLLLFSSIYVLFKGEEAMNLSLPTRQWTEEIQAFLLFIILSVVTIPIHELIHGAFMSLFGGTPKYGLGLAHFVLPYAYASSDKIFSRKQFLQITLAPLVLISLVGIPLMILLDAPWLVIPLAANAGGAVGDVWMSLMLLRYPKHIRVQDRKTGLRIYGKPGDQSLPRSPSGLFWNFLIGCAISLGALLLIFMILPILLNVLGVKNFAIGIPDTPLSVFEYREDESGFASNFGMYGLLALSSAVGLIYGFWKSLKS